MRLIESGICSAKEQELILVPGLGDKKVKRLYQALQEPFRTVKQKSARSDGNSAVSSVSSGTAYSIAAPSVVGSNDEISGDTAPPGDKLQSVMSAGDTAT